MPITEAEKPKPIDSRCPNCDGQAVAFLTPDGDNILWWCENGHVCVSHQNMDRRYKLVYDFREHDLG